MPMADNNYRSVLEQQGTHRTQSPVLPQTIDTDPKKKTNLRTDEYGGTAEKRARFVLDILTETRKAVPSKFCIGIKLNSADHSSASFEDTMAQIKLLVDAGIDFMEISGGTYEDPKMMGYPKTEAAPKSERTAAREAFFLEFAKEVRQRHPDLVLMLTGGFRSRAGAEAAIRDGACDLVGIARPAAVDPKFPLLLLDESVADDQAVLPLSNVPRPFYASFLPRHLIGAGAESVSFFLFESFGCIFGCLGSWVLTDLLDLLCWTDSPLVKGIGYCCACFVRSEMGCVYCVCLKFLD